MGTENLEQPQQQDFQPTAERTTAGGQRAIDWEGLRELSLRPGGFRDQRTSLWPALLGVKPTSTRIESDSENKENGNPTEAQSNTQEPHSDENQIRLDTNRSFVMYPVDIDAAEERDTLKDDLHALLISVFRKRRKLNYFQGYHDIASVLYLTLPPELHLGCMEKLSLHRVRDCMVPTLDPVVGLLRVTRNLLRLADPEYAKILEENTPLPFFALSNLMTLFSHDMPTLALVQHVFDYLLCRPPVAVVYLAVTIILSRKAEALRLQEEGDEGMIHSLLNQLPELVDEVYTEEPSPISEPIALSGPQAPASSPEPPLDAEPVSFPTTLETISEPSPESAKNDTPAANSVEPSADPSPRSTPAESATNSPIPPSTPEPPEPSQTEEENGSRTRRSRAPRRLSSATYSSVRRATSANRSISSRSSSRLGARSRASTLSRDGSVTEIVPSLPHMAALPSLDASLEELLTPTAPTAPAPTPAVPNDGPLPLGELPEQGRRATLKPRVALSDLLQQADELYCKFPPDHPGLKLSTIMGPQSVVHTWSEWAGDDDSATTDDQRDDEAEAMVLQPELIVYPDIPERPQGEEQLDEKGRMSGGSGSDQNFRPGEKRSSRRRRLFKDKSSMTMDTRTKTMVAGAIVVLGVAMAVYGFGHRGGVQGVTVPPAMQKRLTQGKQWFGSALAGATVKYVRELGGLGGGDGDGQEHGEL